MPRVHALARPLPARSGYRYRRETVVCLATWRCVTEPLVIGCMCEETGRSAAHNAKKPQSDSAPSMSAPTDS